MDADRQPDEWYTIEEVAEIFEIPQTSVREAIKQGKLRTWTVAIGKLKFRISRGEIERLIKDSGGQQRLWYRLGVVHDRRWGRMP